MATLSAPHPASRSPFVSPRRLLLSALLAIGVPLAVAACGADAPSAGRESAAGPASVVTRATLRPGDAVPAPLGPVVLTVTGAIGTTNVGDTLQFDMDTLERLGLSEYRVDDRLAEGRPATFRGPLLESVLAVAGVGPEATTLQTRALNDYEVAIPVTDAEDYPVLLATTVDGGRMAVDRFGPVRVIYPYGSFGLEPPEVDEKLIWQLSSIEVR